MRVCLIGCGWAVGKERGASAWRHARKFRCRGGALQGNACGPGGQVSRTQHLIAGCDGAPRRKAPEPRAAPVQGGPAAAIGGSRAPCNAGIGTRPSRECSRPASGVTSGTQPSSRQVTWDPSQWGAHKRRHHVTPSRPFFPRAQNPCPAARGHPRPSHPSRQPGPPPAGPGPPAGRASAPIPAQPPPRTPSRPPAPGASWLQRCWRLEGACQPSRSLWGPRGRRQGARRAPWLAPTAPPPAAGRRPPAPAPASWPSSRSWPSTSSSSRASPPAARSTRCGEP